jgi:hypothetical protein
MEFGDQTLAAKPYGDEVIELIFFKMRYSFEKKKILNSAHFLNLSVGVGAHFRVANGEMSHLEPLP